MADRVFGQAGSFTTGGPTAINATGLAGVFGVALDGAGRLYVTDDNRVLEYDSPLTSQTASRFFGQLGFTGDSCSPTIFSADTLCGPTGVAIDGAGHLYVASQHDRRILEYDSPLTSRTANRVFGQGGSFTTVTGPPFSADTVVPLGLAVDGLGRLWVADGNRVLEYNSPLTSQTANQVLGQLGSFTTQTTNAGGISANSLNTVFDVAVDGGGRLYVADRGNDRVLEYDNPLASHTANRVFGQGGSFTSSGCNSGGVSATSLCHPVGVSVDANGHLYVVDSGNDRVVEFDTPLTSQTADRVFGQAGSFTSAVPNNGGISASSLLVPGGAATDGTGNLYVTDQGNHRMLEFDAVAPAPPVGGVAEQPDVAALPSHRSAAGHRKPDLEYAIGAALTLAAVIGVAWWYVRRRTAR